MRPNNLLHLTLRAGAPLAGELSRYVLQGEVMKTTIAILLLVLPYACSAEDGYVSECPPGSKLQESKTLIGWLTDDWVTTQFGSDGESSTTVVGPFRPVAVLAGSSLAETDGASL